MAPPEDSMTYDDTPPIAGPEDIRLLLDGTRQGRDKAIKRFGVLPVWKIELNEALKTITSLPSPPRFPPRIFLSYRRSTPEKDAWVERLVRNLVRRGYIVIFDRAVHDEFRILVRNEFGTLPYYVVYDG